MADELDKMLEDIEAEKMRACGRKPRWGKHSDRMRCRNLR